MGIQSATLVQQADTTDRLILYTIWTTNIIPHWCQGCKNSALCLCKEVEEWGGGGREEEDGESGQVAIESITSGVYPQFLWHEETRSISTPTLGGRGSLFILGNLIEFWGISLA